MNTRDKPLPISLGHERRKRLLPKSAPDVLRSRAPADAVHQNGELAPFLEIKAEPRRDNVAQDGSVGDVKGCGDRAESGHVALGNV